MVDICCKPMPDSLLCTDTLAWNQYGIKQEKVTQMRRHMRYQMAIERDSHWVAIVCKPLKRIMKDMF